jgi:EpsI family protein
MKSPRFWTVILLLISTAVVLHTRGDADKVPYSQPLALMPHDIGGWTGHDIPIGEDVLSILGKGDFLNRSYAPPAASGVRATVPPISLFIGYFASQRTGQSIHSPQNCLPGAGWNFDSKRYTDLTDDKGNVLHVGEYVISSNGDRQFVVYWYQGHGRTIANEYSAKLHMILDAIRTNRTDGAIVRVITPMLSNESEDAARKRVVDFTARMAPSLPSFIPN